MYPNPVTGNVVTVSFDANSTKTVTIYDVLGKEAVNITTANGTVNVAGLTADVYIVKLLKKIKQLQKSL